jgi:hypothetical protein
MGRALRIGALTALLIGALATPARADTLDTTADGWIAGLSGVNLATFAAFGGIRSDGQVVGSLEHVDHGPDLRVNSTSITSFSPGCTTTMTGEARTTSGDVIFFVTMQDNDEPGTLDTFTIQTIGAISYANSGVLGGGNVQALDAVC